MADDTVDLDEALDAYNRLVEAGQQRSREETARRLADECGVSFVEACAVLRLCGWNAGKARKRLRP